MADETTITSYDDAWVKRMLDSVYGDGAKDARIAEGAGKRLEETLYACSRSATKTPKNVWQHLTVRCRRLRMVT